MKKRLWSLLLCFVLVCSSFAACGKDDTASITEEEDMQGTNRDADPTPTEEPVEDVFGKKMQEFMDTVTELMDVAALEQTEDGTALAGEYTLELEIGAAVAEAYGLSELKKLGLDCTLNMNETETAMTGTLVLNGENILDLDIYEDAEAIYLNLPKYSDSHMKMSMEELFEDQADDMFSVFDRIDTRLSGMSAMGDLKKIWVDFSTQYMDALEFQGVEKNQTITQGDYTVTGDKYTSKLDVEKLGDAVNTLLKETSRLAGQEMEDTLEVDKATEAYVHYYEGADDTFAIVIEVANLNESVVVMSAAAGYCLYTVTGAETEVAFYTVRESDKKGSLVFIDEIGTKTVIEYDNFSENGVDLAMNSEGNTIEFSCQTTGNKTELKFAMPETGIELAAEYEGKENEDKLSMSLSYMEIEFGTLTLNGRDVEYREIAAPENTVDEEAWAEGLNIEAFSADLQQLMLDYPMLTELLLGAMGEDTGAETETGEVWVMPEGYSDEFMGMTGYAMDEDGYVDFEPLVDEVVAAGKPSTGMDTMPLTADQEAQLHDYAKAAYEECYLSENSYYAIYGSAEYESVKSYYQDSHIYYDNSEFGNSIELVFDAISGELGGITVRNTNQAEAVRMMNDLLAITGVDHTVTAENMEEYISVGDIAINGYSGNESYTVYMNIYHY